MKKVLGLAIILAGIAAAPVASADPIVPPVPYTPQPAYTPTPFPNQPPVNGNTGDPAHNICVITGHNC